MQGRGVAAKSWVQDILRQAKPAEKSSKTPVIGSGTKRVEDGWVTNVRVDCI